MSDALKRAIRGRPTASDIVRVQQQQAQQQVQRERATRERQLSEDAQCLAAAERQLEAARQGHLKAVERLREQRVQRKDAAARLDAYHESSKQKRAQAVAALQASTSAAHAAMRADAQGRAARRAEAQARREAERADMHADNPYLVQRLRDEAARAAREKQRNDAQLSAKLAAHKAELATRLARERAQRAKQRDELARRRPLPHVNPELGSGPRTFFGPSCVELG